MTNQESDNKNAEFWNYLCGTNAATYMGFDLETDKGLKDFDAWYMNFYPYLEEYLIWVKDGARTILEVGLGLGTVSRKLAKEVSNFVGVDVAEQPCIFLQRSLARDEIAVTTVKKSILEGPIFYKNNEKFDCAVAIGSLHHTNDLNRALDNVLASVKPGGRILVMVYNEFSAIRFIRNPQRFVKSFIQRISGTRNQWNELDPHARASNDANEVGQAAPYTIYCSKKTFSSRNDSTWEVSYENFSDFVIFGRLFKRDRFLRLARKIGGLDIYAKGTKND